MAYILPAPTIRKDFSSTPTVSALWVQTTPSTMKAPCTDVCSNSFSIVMKMGMQSPSDSQLSSKWALSYDPIKITKPIYPKTILKRLALLNSSNTCFNFNPEYLEQQQIKPHHLCDKIPESFQLPVVLRQSGTVSRYLWDGKDLQLVPVDGTNSFSISDFSLNFENGMRKLGGICWEATRNFFLPRQVTDNYLEYVKWKFLHRVFSSALQVLATQAMFRAIGIGYSRSFPSAAALNWVLKDGLGRLSRCIYTACLASAFDTNLKRVRFSTSVLFSLSIGLELLTPVFPKYFLLLATIANIAKQISLSCYIATGSAVHKSFAIADNLGEVSAKAQIQTVCFDNVGLLLAATFNILLRNNQRLLAALPFVLYPIFSAFDLLGIYQALKHVHLQTLTKTGYSNMTEATCSAGKLTIIKGKLDDYCIFYDGGFKNEEFIQKDDRLELIINTWIELSCIPSPAELSEREGIDLLWNKGSELLPIRIGCLNTKRKIPRLSLMVLTSLRDEDFYFICMENVKTGSRLTDHGILLCLREGAQTSDVIMGLLQACYFRKGLQLDTINWENGVEGGDSVLREWLTLMKESKESAEVDVDVLMEKMSGLGWACRNVLLSTQEQARYSFTN